SEMIETEIETFQLQNPDIEILYHGAPVQSVYNSRRIKMDLLLTISISLILICIILLVCFKNKSTILYLVLPVIYGVLFGLAVIYLIKGSMSLMAMGIGAIIMGVAFSYCIHVITHYKYVTNPVEVLKGQTVPVVLAMLTTIGAFMGLLLTKSELLQDFGLFASLGLLGTTFFCLIFLPQLFKLKNNRKSDKALAIIDKINSFPFEKQKWLIALILIVSAISFIFSGKVKFDSDLQNIGYNDARIMRSKDLLNSKANANFSTIYFASVSDNLDSALVYNRQMCEKLDKLVESGEIKGYSNPASLFIPTSEQEKRIERWNRYWTEDKKMDLKAEVAIAGNKYKFTQQTFMPFFDMLDEEYKPVSLYDADVIPKGLLDNIIEYSDDRYLIFVPVQMDRKNLSETGYDVVGDNPEFVVVDPMYYTNDMVKSIHNDFNVTLTISSLFVLIVLLISYKSIILALIAFLPMGLSWYIVLGFMVLFGMEFNLINIIISAFIFGIGVDYSIFIMDGLLTSYRTKERLIMYHKTAIFFSAVILIIVIASLLFAVHPAISSIGASTLVGMGATILIAYSLQPFLFSLLISDRAAKGKSPISMANLFTFDKKNKPNNEIIRNNYLYKGNAVELLLKHDLVKTNCYALLTALLDDKKSMLDYGCGYGFSSYWASLNDKQIEIAGYDTDENAIRIADNCYQKTERMQFTTDSSVLQSAYDIIIVNKDEKAIDDETIKNLFLNAKTVIVRKDIAVKYENVLKNAHFNVKEEDTAYVAYTVL
ncbi:MMPL family transporter, partial [Bacteroidales bacterium OttesenSCG-928-I21]|nr:MMPL family transporter [Bacteroidales bacterium OttesenSCG-928-I21]